MAAAAAAAATAVVAMDYRCSPSALSTTVVVAFPIRWEIYDRPPIAS